jgi:hypothetical protein
MFDAYNIRKIAPRMLLAVIGVNLSIYLCVAAVDVVNVVGGGLASLIREPFLDAAVFNSLGLDPGSGVGGKVATGIIVGGVGVGVATGFLGTMLGGAIGIATGSIPFILIVLLLLILSGILIALAIMATVVIRYGAIILLTLVSPVAISMLVLPGTEKYFRKWWEYFTKTLMVYPIIAAIFAVSDVMGAVFLKAQDQGGGAADPLQDIIVIFVIIVVVYAPLFMIPFSFKLAGGFLGSIYDLANKNMYGRAKPRMDKWKERPDSLYSQKRMQAQKAREGAFGGKGVTFSQIGKGLSAGARGARNPDVDPVTGEKLSRRQAFRERYKKASLYQGGSMSRAAAIEAEEKDSRVKDILGNDDLGYAMHEYAKTLSEGGSEAEAEKAARAGLAYKDEFMYDPNKTQDAAEKRQRMSQQSAAFDQIKAIHGTYQDKTTMMIGARQDARASTGEDALSMRKQVLAATAGGQDQLGMTAFLNDVRGLAKEAKRGDKAGIGFTGDLEVMEALKAGTTSDEQAREDLLMGALEKSSASEIATMHDKGVKQIQGVLGKRVEKAKQAAIARGLSGEDVMQDEGYQTAMAQVANLYDAFQYAAPKNLHQTDEQGNEVGLAAFVNQAGVSGGSLLTDMEKMRGKDESYKAFALNRRDWGASEAEEAARRGGGQPQPGGGG